MRLANFVAAMTLAALAVGCGQDDSAQRDRRIPLTKPKEMVPLSAETQAPPAVAQGEGKSAPRPLVANPLPPASQPASIPAAKPIASRRATTPETQPATKKAAVEPDIDLARRLTIHFEEEQTESSAAKPVGQRVASKPANRKAEPEELRILGGPEVVTGSVIQVNSKFFTVDDILKAAGPDLAEIPCNISEDSFRVRAGKVINEEIRRQISQAMTLPEAEMALTDEAKKQIDKEMDETLTDMIAQAGGSRKQLETNLRKQGTTLQAVLDNQRRKLTVQMFMRLRFLPAVSVSRAMLWDYYVRRKEEFSAPKKVQMQIISVPFKSFIREGSIAPTEDELSMARAKARDHIALAAKAVHAGEDFGKVAEKYSLGPKPPSEGLWPLMPAGSFREEKVEQIAFEQESGQVSEIIETDTGFYVVKTKQVEPAATITFEDAQPKIEKILREQVSTKLYTDYYMGLLKDATIVQPENFVPQAVDATVNRFWRK